MSVAMLEGGGHSGPCKRCTSCLGLGGGHTGVGTNVSVLAVYTHGCCTSLLIPDTSRKSREKEGAVTPRYRNALNLVMCLVLDAQARACRCRWPRDAPPFPAEQGVTRVSRRSSGPAHTPSPSRLSFCGRRGRLSVWGRGAFVSIIPYGKNLFGSHCPCCSHLPDPITDEHRGAVVNKWLPRQDNVGSSPQLL